MLKTKNILALIGLFICFATTGQELPDSTIKKIDKLFPVLGGGKSPGYTVGIVRNDSLIFAKGYGMANLEYNIPNAPESIYHIASVSKQFTAYCILLLEQAGKLKLDDDVRKYLPWFPDLKEKITIQHLLNHTSGIRDHWDLNVISGRRMDDVITQDYLVTLLSRQQGLNFKPGAEFSYSNSNYTMMAEIVKNISGRSFRQFADSAIFKPLGMKFTHVHDDHTEVVPNRAYSYNPFGNSFTNAVLNYANAGATSLFTNVPDMAKWVMNFYNPKIGSDAVLQKFIKNGVLNNGKTIPYASGIIADVYNGEKRWYHNGGDAGYRTFVSVFPEEKMGFIVFSNLATANINALGNGLADIFFKPLPPPEIKRLDSSLARLKDTVSIAKFMGNYISEDGVQFSYKIDNGQVFWITPGAPQLLAKVKNDTLALVANQDIKFIFSGSGANDMTVDQYWPDNHRRLKKYTPATTDAAQLAKELNEYVGTYYGPETDFKYTMSISGNNLQLGSNQSFTQKNTLVYIHKDLFRLGGRLFRFKRNNKNQVIGFEMNTGRTRHLVFNKVAN